MTQQTIKLSDYYIKKSDTSGLVKNDGNIISTNNFIQGASDGLIKDGTNLKVDFGDGNKQVAIGNHTHNNYISTSDGSVSTNNIANKSITANKLNNNVYQTIIFGKSHNVEIDSTVTIYAGLRSFDGNMIPTQQITLTTDRGYFTEYGAVTNLESLSTGGNPVHIDNITTQAVTIPSTGVYGYGYAKLYANDWGLITLNANEMRTQIFVDGWRELYDYDNNKTDIMLASNGITHKAYRNKNLMKINFAGTMNVDSDNVSGSDRNMGQIKTEYSPSLFHGPIRAKCNDTMWINFSGVNGDDGYKKFNLYNPTSTKRPTISCAIIYAIKDI